MKFIKNIEKEVKKLKLSKESISLGLIFALTFYIVLDSIILGLTFGFIFMIALNEEEKRKTKKN
jgi:hypothetical protein